MKRALVAAALAALGLAPVAAADRVAVGLTRGADPAAVQRAVEQVTGRPAESLAPVPALLVDAPRPAALTRLAGVRYVERIRERRQAFAPNDPLVPRQWYLAQNRAYDAWQELPPLAPVRVAVIDSGVDGNHPELVGRIAGARSFVGGSARVDTQGHGTFVAGIIAAEANNAAGIAGLSPTAELLVAKVVTRTRTIPVDAEVKAIRWAVAQGARVLNMSLGGVRDPLDPERDTYSRLEADAIAYAVRKGVLVVAAVGNSDQAPEQPWRYASYPAALPHVLGVSAVGRTGSAPAFSNRDAIFNDIAAPGEAIVSTFPRTLTADRPDCPEQGYSPCASDEYRAAEGTSFAAPQVTAAAATLLAVEPKLRADQVATVLTRTAVDATPANGCKPCGPGRDSYTGWGRLDVTAAVVALSRPLPAADRLEPNDDAGRHARRLWGARPRVDATLDFWEDQSDVYAIMLRKGQRLFASVQGAPGTDPALAVWLPGTRSVDDLRRQDLRLKVSTRTGRNDVVGIRARRTGLHFLQVKLPLPGAGPYRLAITKRR